MDRRQQVIVSLAVDVLRAAVARCGDEKVNGPEIRLALRCLVPHCPERWPLDMFWESAQQDNEIGRAQGVTAAFNGVVRQLRSGGAWRE